MMKCLTPFFPKANKMAGKILSESKHDGQIIYLTLNAPKGNVLDAEMMADLQDCLEDLKNKPDVKLIQFIGEGNHFSFGASVEEHTKENAPKMLKQFHQLFYSLIELAIPTCAIVSGQCLGGGLELALMCNFIFCDKTAKLGQPEIMLGVYAPPASLIMPMKLGQSYADDMLLTGKIIDAECAKKVGLVHSVYEDKENMMSAVDEWVQKNILPKSASSLRCANRAARRVFNKTLKKHLGKLEKYYVEDLMNTHDANEGIQSFLEKRKPDWKNR
jgi:cyclohexa-1,5-dienecarbonyl-CoA hydratase